MAVTQNMFRPLYTMLPGNDIICPMMDIATLQAALIGYELEKKRIERAMADIRDRLRQHTPGQTAPLDLPRRPPSKKKRRMSAEGRARIAEAQQKRWAAQRSASANG